MTKVTNLIYFDKNVKVRFFIMSVRKISIKDRMHLATPDSLIRRKSFTKEAFPLF